MEKSEYGLVLSGGGVRGIAHAGVIKALEEFGIFPKVIAGSSSGAMVGSLYAAGYSPEDILDFFERTPFFTYRKFVYRKAGFLDTSKFYKDFLELLPDDSFEALKKKLFITVTDLYEGKSVFYSSGQLIMPVLASAAFPMMMTPVMIDNKLYADGGIINNFPTEPVKPLVEKLVGVYVNPIQKVDKAYFKNPLSVANRAYRLTTGYASFKKFSECDLLIQPLSLSKFNTFDVNHLKEIFEIGYREAKEELAEMIAYNSMKSRNRFREDDMGFTVNLDAS